MKIELFMVWILST